MQIIALILRVGWLILLSFPLLALFATRKVLSHPAGSRLLRWYFQSCGGAFLKCGQVLATRYDLLPRIYCDELGKLLDQLPPVPANRVFRVLERDLGTSSNSLFASVDQVPLASASIAQVHTAELRTGERIVLKIKKPGVDSQFRIDFLIIKILASLIDSFTVLGRIDVRAIAKEIIDLASEELDFRREAQNAQRIHTLLLSDDIDHYAPKVYFAFSGRSVIALERIDGISIQRLLELGTIGDQSMKDADAERQGNRRRLAKLLLRSVMEQTMHHRLFQADPHPANLLVMKGGTLAWVDFGMTGWLDERNWALQFRIRESVAAERIHEAYQSFLRTLEPLPPGKDLSRFESEVKGYLQDWISASRNPNASLAEKSSGFFLLRTFDAIRRAGLRMPMNVMRLYRSMVISDMVVLRLDPSIDWVPVLRDFVQEETARRLLQSCLELFSPKGLYSVLRAWSAGPKAFGEISDWAQNRLPEIGRTYYSELSRFERLALVSLEYGRLALTVSVAAVLGSRFLARGLFPGSAWERFPSAMGGIFWPAVGIGCVGILFLSRLIAQFRRS